MPETEKTTLEDKPKKRTYKRKYTRKPKETPPVVVNDPDPEPTVEPEAEPVTEDLEAVLMKDITPSEPIKREDTEGITMTGMVPRTFRMPTKEKKTRKVWGEGAILMSKQPTRRG
jgi:hypothetical protein